VDPESRRTEQKIRTEEQSANEQDENQHVTSPPDSQKNFLVVDGKTETSAIEAAFDSFTVNRKDIGIVLINQHVRLSRSSPTTCLVLSASFLFWLRPSDTT